MAIRNTRRDTTLNVQSDPVDNGNDTSHSAEPILSESVNLGLNNDRTDSLADDSNVSFSAATRHKKTRRSQATNKHSVYRRLRSNSYSRTIPSSISASISSRDQSPVTLYTPPPKKITEDVESDSSGSRVPVGPTSGMNSYMLQHSISNLRPELIASLDWQVQNRDHWYFGGVQSLLEFRWALRQLQIENVEETIKRLKDVDIGGIFSTLEKKYEYYTEKEEMWIEWREKILNILLEAKRSLDIKENASHLRAGTASGYAKRSHLGVSTGKNTRLDSLFINELGFSESGYKKFSNSKVYGQMLFDLYFSCVTHSTTLLHGKGSERSEDENSTRINLRAIPRTKTYKFRASSIGNRGKTKFDVTKYNNYSRFASQLPANDSDKIKVLMMAISSEFVTSSGIGYLTGTSLGKRFNVDARDPYGSALGRRRKSIMHDGAPTGSLASFSLLRDSRDRKILPFETRDFSNGDGSHAVAGSSALVDGIMRFGRLSDGLDFEPFSDFGFGLNNTTNDVVEYLAHLLNMSDPDQQLHARTIFLKILSAFTTCIFGTQSARKRSEQQLVISSLMKMSRENPRLRHKLLRFTLEVRDARDQLVIDTGTEEFLEPDADDPRPRPPSPSFHLQRVGGFRPQTAITPEWIQRTYNISHDAAINLVRTTTSFSNLNKKARLASAKEEEARKKEYYKMASHWQRTSLWISIDAKRASDAQARPPEEINTSAIVKLRSIHSVASILKKSASSSSSYYSPFSHIIKIAREIQEMSVDLANRDDAGGVYMDERRLSKHNSWDENALIATIFEIFTVLYARFTSADLIQHDNMLYVKYDTEVNKRSVQACRDVLSISMNQDPLSRSKQIKERLASSADPHTTVLTKDMLEGKLSILDALQSASNIDTSEAVFADVQSFVAAFESEFEFKNLLISHLESIGTSLGRSAFKVKTFFNTAEEDFSASGVKQYQAKGRHQESNRIRRYMAWKTRSQFGRDVLRSLTPHQLALQRIASIKMSRKDDDESYLPAESIIEPEEMSALKALLSAPEMSGITGENIRVMTVGIPMDMIDILQNPPYVMGEKNNSELSRAEGVFEVHVHKRDLEYEDIIFHPKKFVYDRSVFLLPDAFRKIKPVSTRGSRGGRQGSRKFPRKWSFDKMVKNTEFTVATHQNLTKRSSQRLYDDSKYRNIPEKKRVQLIQNHITDSLLHMYYRIQSGLSFDENTFLRNESWAQLLVDSDAAKMLRIAQIHNSTKTWVNTGTIPVGNLLLDTKIQDTTRIRVATFKDSEIWTKPTLTQLANLARDLRVVNKGKYRKHKSARTDYWGVGESKSRGYSRKITVQQHLEIQQQLFVMPSSLRKTFTAANPKHPSSTTGPAHPSSISSPAKPPPPPPPPWPQVPADAISGSNRPARNNWNKMVKRHNRGVAKHNKRATSHNKKLHAYEMRKKAKLKQRFYRRKPKLSSSQLQHFRMVCTSRILGPCVMINQILAPRTFDRVLMIPVDPDDFEIDMNATSDILAGKTLAQRKEFTDMTYEAQDSNGHPIRKLKPRRRSENFSSFNDFFVTISTLTPEDSKS